MVIELPAPELKVSDSLVSCIQGRRSIREFKKESLPLGVLSQLLWSAQGITAGNQKRATPSAGGLYPLNLHLIVQQVSELSRGNYVYRPDSHSLNHFGDPVSMGTMYELGIGDQPWLKDAAVVIGVSARLEDANRHFKDQKPRGERGARYVYMETGALAQNVHLQCTALGVGSVLVAGFDDEKVRDALNMPVNLQPTALLCVGCC